MGTALKIGEVARQAGIPASALRYYESIGLLPPAVRSGGWRRYPPDVLERLLVIRTGRELGFTLDDLRTLLDGFPTDTPAPPRWRALAARKLPVIDDLIRRATAMKKLLHTGLTCDCVRIEDCFIDDCSGSLRGAAPVRGALPVLEAGRAETPEVHRP